MPTRETPERCGRIDGLMAASLSYILWFAVFPLVRLW